MKNLLRAGILSGIAILSPGKSLSDKANVPASEAIGVTSGQILPDSEFFREDLPKRIKEIMETVRESSLSDLIPDDAVVRTVETVRLEPGVQYSDSLSDNMRIGRNISEQFPSSVWQSHFCDPFRGAGIDCDTAWYRKNRGDSFLRAGYDIHAAVASAFARTEAEPDDYYYYGNVSLSGKQLFPEIHRRMERPEELRQLYREKKPVLITALSSFDRESRERFLSWLKNVEENVLPALRKKEFQEGYARIEDLTKRMQKNPVSMEDILNKTADENQRVQLREARRRLSRSLGKETDDIASALFFFGLPEDVQEAWKNIVRDLRRAVQEIP